MSNQQRKPDPVSNPNDRQIGGDHYQTDFQHWDFVETLGIGYLEGCATKYLDRHTRKGKAVQDLQKARHYVEKIISLAKEGRPNPLNRSGVSFGAVTKAVGSFLQARDRDSWEAKCIKRIAIWTGIDDLEFVVGHITDAITREEEVEADVENMRNRPDSGRTDSGEAGPRYANQG